MAKVSIQLINGGQYLDTYTNTDVLSSWVLATMQDISSSGTDPYETLDKVSRADPLAYRAASLAAEQQVLNSLPRRESVLSFALPRTPFNNSQLKIGKGIDVCVWVDGFPSYIEAQVRVTSYTTNAYEVELLSRANDWRDTVGRLRLRDVLKGARYIDYAYAKKRWKQDGYYYDRDNSDTADPNQIFTLPLCFYGSWQGGASAIMQDFRYWFFVLPVLQKAFSAAGYTFICPFLDSIEGRRSIMYLGGSMKDWSQVTHGLLTTCQDLSTLLPTPSPTDLYNLPFLNAGIVYGYYDPNDVGDLGWWFDVGGLQTLQGLRGWYRFRIRCHVVLYSTIITATPYIAVKLTFNGAFGYTEDAVVPFPYPLSLGGVYAADLDYTFTGLGATIGGGSLGGLNFTDPANYVSFGINNDKGTMFVTNISIEAIPQTPTTSAGPPTDSYIYEERNVPFAWHIDNKVRVTDVLSGLAHFMGGGIFKTDEINKTVSLLSPFKYEQEQGYYSTRRTLDAPINCRSLTQTVTEVPDGYVLSFAEPETLESIEQGEWTWGDTSEQANVIRDENPTFHYLNEITDTQISTAGVNVADLSNGENEQLQEYRPYFALFGANVNQTNNDIPDFGNWTFTEDDGGENIETRVPFAFVDTRIEFTSLVSQLTPENTAVYKSQFDRVGFATKYFAWRIGRQLGNYTYQAKIHIDALQRFRITQGVNFIATIEQTDYNCYCDSLEVSGNAGEATVQFTIRSANDYLAET